MVALQNKYLITKKLIQPVIVAQAELNMTSHPYKASLGKAVKNGAIVISDVKKTTIDETETAL